MLRRRTALAAGLGAVLAPAARAAEPNWPAALTLLTASPGGTYDAYGAGLARILARELGLRVAAVATGGPSENIARIEAGEAELGFVTMGTALQAWNGTGEWTQGRRYRAFRAVFPMYDTPFDLVVMRGSPIQDPAGLTGKRVGVGPEGGTASLYAPRLLGTLGLSVTPVHGTWEELANQLQGGGLDAMAAAAGVPFPAVLGLESRGGIRHLALSPEQVVALRLAVPELGESLIPAGTYPSLMAGYRTVGLYNFAVAHESLPADLVYRITKAVFDHHEEMLEVHPAAAATVPGNFVHNTFLPYHEGAVRYYGNSMAAGVMLAD